MLGDVKLTLVETLDDAMNLKRWLGETRPVLGVDTETGGLDWWHDPLRLVQIGDANHGWALPWPQWGGFVKEILEGYDDTPMAMHNSKFDLHFLEWNGIKMNRALVHDTMFMAHLDDNDSSVALKNLSARYIDPRSNALQRQLAETMTKNKWSWGSIPHEYPLYWMYGALDPVLTARLYEMYTPRIAAFRESYDLELGVMQALLDAERRGTRVDVEYCQYARDGMLARVDELYHELKKLGVNSPGSNDQVAKKLESQGVVFTRWTKRGKPIMDEDVLGAIDLPVAKYVLEFRHLKKIAKTYLANFIDLSDDNEMLHPSIRTLGARTGRMSVGRPSLQNLERTSDVRDAFIPRDGNKLVLIDYDQIEMRIFAHYSASARLAAAFDPSAEIDGFTTMARNILDDQTISKDDPRRQTTKNAGYAKIYGAGISTFAGTAGLDNERARMFMEQFDATYPEVQNFINKCVVVSGQRSREFGNPYVETWYGRRLLIHNDKKLYKLVNYLIQGGAAQVLKQKIILLNQAGLADYFVLPIHDELMFDVPEPEVEDYMREVIPVMEDHDTFMVPLTVEAKTADRWGEHYPRGAYTTTKISEELDDSEIVSPY